MYKKTFEIIENLINISHKSSIQNDNFEHYESIELLVRLEYIAKRHSRENCDEKILSNRDIIFLRSLNKEERINVGRGLDYTLELTETKPTVNHSNYPFLFNLICLPKEKEKGLIRENHGMGYHIHYVIVRKKEECRTNIVFTFNRKLAVKQIEPKLYWEKHGSRCIERYPEKFKNRRKNAIYDTSCSFLKKVSVTNFRMPKTNASILWPVR